MRFSANLGFLWRDLPFLERIARAAAAGFDAVEFHDDAQAADPAALGAALAQAGLPVLCLNTSMREGGLAGVPGREGNARAHIDRAIEVAKAVGAGALTCMMPAAPLAHSTPRLTGWSRLPSI